MPSLGFAMLDRHVVAGRADDLAVDVDGATLTFARLLEHSAALAGGLKVLGVGEGDLVVVDLPPGPDRVTAVCACLRLGALPGRTGRPGGSTGPQAGTGVQVRHVDGVSVVTAGADRIDLVTVRRAGTSDPAVALPGDVEGFGEQAEACAPDVVLPLLAGRPVTV